MFDISNIYVTLLVKSSFNNSEKIIFKSISKKQLENDLNYKIIKKEKVKYEKVTLHWKQSYYPNLKKSKKLNRSCTQSRA